MKVHHRSYVDVASKRLVLVFRFLYFPGYSIGQPLANGFSHHVADASSVVHRLSIVVAKCLFIHVPKQMERRTTSLRKAIASGSGAFEMTGRPVIPLNPPSKAPTDAHRLQAAAAGQREAEQGHKRKGRQTGTSAPAGPTKPTAKTHDGPRCSRQHGAQDRWGFHFARGVYH